jgi:hypothetical protein
MIHKRTVFVLGAGANVPYGFSTGGGLLQKARDIPDPRAHMGNAGLQVSPAESAAFRAAVVDNLLPSIDAMLEHRPDLLRVGKRIMAKLLYEEEVSAGPRSFDEDWISLIFGYMAEDAPTLAQFSQNALSFVTFNYDRYLEHRFIRGLVARYQVDPREAWQKIAPWFIHLYGSLGALPDQMPPSAALGEVVPLGAPASTEVYTLGLVLPRAENEMKIVHDTAQPPASFVEAGKRFKSAEQTFFLGFGFGKKNVERLQTKAIPPPVPIHCTTFDMTAAEYHDAVIPAFVNSDHIGELRRQNSTGTKSIRLFLRERVGLFR